MQRFFNTRILIVLAIISLATGFSMLLASSFLNAGEWSFIRKLPFLVPLFITAFYTIVLAVHKMFSYSLPIIEENKKEKNTNV